MKKKAIVERGIFITYAVYSTQQPEVYNKLKAKRNNRKENAVDIITQYCEENNIEWDKFRIISVYTSKILGEPAYIIETFIQPTNH